MLLSFRVDRLRRAAAAAGLNEAGLLAGKAGVSRNTISGWYKKEIRQGEVERKRGRTGPVFVRARSEVLTRVAEAVTAPVVWLTGPEDLPFVPRHGPLAYGMGHRKRTDPEDVGEAKLAHSLLLWRVDQAVRRDLRRWNAEDEDVATGVRLAIDDLASVVQWRIALVQPINGDSGAFLGRIPEGKLGVRLRRSHAKAAVFNDLSMVQSVSDILQPWFDEAATLDALALHQILGPLLSGNGKLIFVRPRDRHDANLHRLTVLSALVRYATLAVRLENSAMRPASSRRSREARGRPRRQP